MKRILFISLLCISAFIGYSQTTGTLRINKHTTDSVMSPGVRQLWYDTTGNGTYKLVSTQTGGGSGSGVTTMAAIGSSSNANGASISGSTLTLQAANETYGGLLSATSQKIAGDKTFMDGDIYIGDPGVYPANTPHGHLLLESLSFEIYAHDRDLLLYSNQDVHIQPANGSGSGFIFFDGYTTSPFTTADTTTYKPVVINSSGQVMKSTYWPGGSGVAASNTYVSPTGLSSGDGSTQATAVNAARFLTLAASFTGNNNIYFEAGGEYPVDFQIYSNTYVGSYGVGAMPIIKGTIPGTDLTWTQAGTVWSAPYATRVGRVLKDGVAETTAQSAFYEVTSRPSDTEITASTATGLSNVTAMEMISKEYAFRWTYNTISNYNSGTGNFTVDRVNGIVAGFKFKLFNHPDLITNEGDWAWVSGTVYYKSPGNVNPNTLDVELSVYEEGIRISDNATNVTIDGINFYAQSVDGVYGNDNTNVSVVNCIFSNQLNHAIAIIGDDKNISINKNTISDVGFTGIGGYKWTNFEIKSNTINDIGTQADPPFNRYLTSRYDNIYAVNAGIVVSTNSSKGVIEENIIDSAAYIGIRFDGHEISVNKNKITYTLLRATDGGALYTIGDMGDGTTCSYNNTVTNNYTSYTIGSLEGADPSTFNMANGIYFDSFAEDMVVAGNTSQDNSTYGIFSNDVTRDITFDNNILYYNNVAQLAIYNTVTLLTGAYESTGMVVKNNTHTSLNTTQEAIRIQGASGGNPFDNNGYAINNTFINPYNSIIVHKDVSGVGTNYSLASAATFYSTQFGRQDVYSASYVDEATARANVPIFLNTTTATLTSIVPDGFRNPINQNYNQSMPPLQGAVFVTGAAFTLTTNDTTGAATYDAGTGILNIPQYTGGGGGSSSWTQASNNIYPTSATQVGIGISDPLVQLHIYSASNSDVWIQGGQDADEYSQIVFANATTVTSGNYAQFIRFSNATTANPGEFIAYNEGHDIIFSTNYSTSYRKDLVINSSGQLRNSFLAGAFTRMVVADPDGDISTQSIPTSQWDDITSSSRSGIDYAGGFVAINTTSPFPGISNSDVLENGLDVAGAVIMVGNNEALDGRTTNTNKVGRLVAPHYDLSEEPIGIIIGASNSTDNTIFFGGASGAVNAATLIAFYAADNNITTTGTQMARITTSGLELTAGQLTIDTQFTPSTSTDSAKPNKTLTADDTYLWYRTSSGTWKKIAWTAF